MKLVALFSSAALAGVISLAHLSPHAPGVVVKPNPYATCPPPVVQAHDAPAVASLHYCPQ